MVIDSSALLAILQDEPERRMFIEVIEAADTCSLSVVNLVETALVLESRRGPEAGRTLDAFIAKAGIELVPVDAEQAAMARSAFARFGKGRHPAGLNFGDCFAYALAKISGDSLLLKGNDFSRTDIPVHATGVDQ